MPLDPAVREALASVVGAENLSDGRPVTQTYAYNWGVELLNAQRGLEPCPFTHEPVAVVLPGSTAEVQQVVQLCNAHGLRFKAQSTGFGPWNTVSGPDTLVVDLRRMNRIVKIDPANLYAVVEPYVSGAQLQAELMKDGLNCHMPGAGPQVSPLASATSMAGHGFTSPSTGFSGRNVLGVEWVLPSGEILRLGALGNEADPDWYTGDGPGPSLRGIMRGYSGTKSGLGIFTRCAVKLYPFPCAPEWSLSGNSPKYEFEIPDFLQYHILNYKSYEALERAIVRIEEEELAFMCFHTSKFGLATIFANTLWRAIWNIVRVVIRRVKRPLVVLVAARTEREFQYKEKVMAAVVAETGGKDLTKTGKFVPKSLFYAEALRPQLGFHSFLVGRTFQSTHGGMDTFTMCRKMMQANIPLKKAFIKRRVIADDTGDGVWSTSFEHGHFFHAEMPTMYDQTQDRSIKGMAEYFDETNKMDLVNHLGIPFFIEGDEMHDWYGPHCSDYHVWLRQIKAAFDPNGTADPGFYISANPAGTPAGDESEK